jgi:hypothetical protein
VSEQVAVRFCTATSPHNVAPVSVSLNPTVEVGEAAPEFAGVNVAVKVTDWFTNEVGCEEVTTTARFPGVTI